MVSLTVPLSREGDDNMAVVMTSRIHPPIWRHRKVPGSTVMSSNHPPSRGANICNIGSISGSKFHKRYPHLLPGYSVTLQVIL